MWPCMSPWKCPWTLRSTAAGSWWCWYGFNTCWTFFSLSLLEFCFCGDKLLWSSNSLLLVSSRFDSASSKGLGLEVKLCWLSCMLEVSWTLRAASNARLRDRSKLRGLQDRLCPWSNNIEFWLFMDLGLGDMFAWRSRRSMFLALSRLICCELSWWGLSNLRIGSKALCKVSRFRGKSWLLEILVLPTCLSVLSLTGSIAEHWQGCCGFSVTSRSLINSGWDILLSGIICIKKIYKLDS